VDGAPAARFMKRFADLLTRGDLLGADVLGVEHEQTR
jgi:hypothetical protein